MTRKKDILFGALQDLRVLDFTQVLAGPFCTQLLADHGAQVIKVEPLYGDETRKIGPFRPDDSQRAFGGYYQSVNRNKYGLALDLKSPKGRDIALRLVEKADVVVENYRPGVMDRLGLGYETLAERNPMLVYAALTGFGDSRTGESPYDEWPALDVVAQAMGGLMGITGPASGEPIKIGPGVGDLFPGALAAFGILAAVLSAKATGKGQFVNVSMVDGVLALCERIVHQYSYTGYVARPEGNRHPILCPFGLFKARDGWIAIAAQSERFWTALCEAMERHDLITDPRFRTNNDRLANKEATYSIVEKFVAHHTLGDIKEMLGGKLPIGPVYSVEDIFADEHFRKRNMLVEVDQPGSETPVVIAGVPVQMTGTPGGVMRRAPLLGEHTDSILTDLGFDDVSIKELRNAKVIAPKMENKL